MKEKVAILGGGASGISCGYHLKKLGIQSTIFEKDSDWGGLCGNFSIDGFRFDRFVHFSHTSNKYVKNLISNSTPLSIHKPEASNYYKGQWLRHPAINNLYPLSPVERRKIITDFILSSSKKKKINNYEDWLKNQYGDYFAEKFPMQYTQKYWTVPAKSLETKWVGNKMHRSSIDQILQGAFSNHDRTDYYANQMRYPKVGGYRSILNGMKKDVNVILNKKVIQIDSEKKKYNL